MISWVNKLYYLKVFFFFFFSFSFPPWVYLCLQTEIRWAWQQQLAYCTCSLKFWNRTWTATELMITWTAWNMFLSPAFQTPEPPPSSHICFSFPLNTRQGTHLWTPTSQNWSLKVLNAFSAAAAAPSWR